MFLRRSSLLLASTLLVAEATARSQSPAPTAGGMTLSQYLDHETKRVMAADTDGDGRISHAEMEKMGSLGGHHPERRFAAVDTNHDGYLDRAEIQAALTQRFQRMDRNGDGVVSPDEHKHHGGDRGRAGTGTQQP